MFLWYSQISKTIKRKFTYNGWGVTFDGEGMWSFDIDFVIFGISNNSSSYTNNWKNDFSILGEGPTNGINDSTRAAEKI